MPKLTFIGRVSDGLILCETYEDLQRENFELKNLAKNILKKLARAADCGALDTELNHTQHSFVQRIHSERTDINK